MDLSERLGLVKNNCVEVVEENELRQLLERKKKPATYCGYEPSGEVHLGHVVTVTKLAELEKAGFHVKVLFADWHAWLNKKGSWDEIKELTKLWKKVFGALGLKKPEFVLGSSFQMKKEYFEDVLKLSRDTTVNRAMRAMQEVARDVEHASVSQMIYPLMQIADIKHLGLDAAQSGIEQRKIHMLARESLEGIAWKKPVCVHTPLVNSLDGPGNKMSSSKPESLISVRDSPEDIKKKLNKAYCVEGEVEGNPALEIARLVLFPRVKGLNVDRPEKFGGNLSFASADELEKAFAEKRLHPADLKNAVAGELARVFEPVRKLF